MTLTDIEQTISIENNINITNIVNKVNIDNELNKTNIDKGLLEKLTKIKDFWELLGWLGEVYKKAKPFVNMIIKKIIVPAISNVANVGGVEYLDVLIQLYPSRGFILNIIKIEYNKNRTS